MSVVGAASSPKLGAQQGCLQECPSFPYVVIAPPLPLFLLIILDMGSDIWVWALGPIAPQRVAWMHFANVAEALRYLRSAHGGSLRIQHTQVARAAKANASWDGYAFTFEEPSSLVVASPPALAAHTGGTRAQFVNVRFQERPMCLLRCKLLRHQAHMQQVPTGC